MMNFIQITNKICMTYISTQREVSAEWMASNKLINSLKNNVLKLLPSDLKPK